MNSELEQKLDDLKVPAGETLDPKRDSKLLAELLVREKRMLLGAFEGVLAIVAMTIGCVAILAWCKESRDLVVALYAGLTIGVVGIVSIGIVQSAVIEPDWHDSRWGNTRPIRSKELGLVMERLSPGIGDELRAWRMVDEHKILRFCHVERVLSRVLQEKDMREANQVSDKQGKEIGTSVQPLAAAAKSYAQVQL